MTAEDGQLELWTLPEQAGHDSALVAATKSTLYQLRDGERLPPERASLAQLCLALAEAIDKGARSGRASAVAMAAAQLRETMLVLDPVPEDGDAQADALRMMREFMAKLDAAAEADHPGLRVVQ